MAIREGAWDCPVCGRKRNRGPEKFCGGCGSPRGEDVPFYLPEDAAEVADAEALRRARLGPDWICQFCESDNTADNGFCSSCGASRDGATVRPVIEHRDGQTPPSPPPPAESVAAAPAAAPGRKPGFLKLGCLGLLLLLGALWCMGQPRQETLTVTGFRWERTIDVEAPRTVTEEGWEGEVPGALQILSSRREVHHHNRVQIGSETRTRTVTERVQTGTEQVKVGTRDLGNGYFEDVYEDRPVYEEVSREETYEEPVYREEPIYRNRIRYQVEKWETARAARAAAADRSPRWPDPGLQGREREKARAETYEVLFVDEDGEARVYRARSQTEWESFEEGRSYRARVGGGGEVVEILDPA